NTIPFPPLPLNTNSTRLRLRSSSSSSGSMVLERDWAWAQTIRHCISRAIALITDTAEQTIPLRVCSSSSSSKNNNNNNSKGTGLELARADRAVRFLFLGAARRDDEGQLTLYTPPLLFSSCEMYSGHYNFFLFYHYLLAKCLGFC